MRILGKKGFTLLEMILASAIVAIFLLGSGVVLSSAAKVYVQETTSSGARGAIETAGDDIKNYIMSGKDIRLMFYMDGTREEIILANGDSVSVVKKDISLPDQPLKEGTILYTDGTYLEKDGSTGKIAAIANFPNTQKALTKVAEGIDLGYKRIYLTEGGKYIQGLPYSQDYYRGMTMSLEICEADSMQNAFYVNANGTEKPADGRYKGQTLYTIKLTGKLTGKDDGDLDVFTVIQNTAVVSMNDIKFE